MAISVARVFGARLLESELNAVATSALEHVVGVTTANPVIAVIP